MLYIVHSSWKKEKIWQGSKVYVYICVEALICVSIFHMFRILHARNLVMSCFKPLNILNIIASTLTYCNNDMVLSQDICIVAQTFYGIDD